MRVLVLSLSLLVLTSVPAWAARTVAVVPSDVDDVKSLDEVVVQGDRTLSAARKAIVDAEDRFYARLNTLNHDRRFDIKCEIRTPTGTRFGHRVCQPAFAESLERDGAQAFVEQLQGAKSTEGGVISLASPDSSFLVLTSELKRRTLAFLQKDAELKRALLERARLEQHYVDLRREKFRDHWVVWD